MKTPFSRVSIAAFLLTCTTHAAKNLRMKIKTLITVIAILSCGCVLQSQAAINILLAADATPSTDLETRFSALGHTVTVSNPAAWDATFDYSSYDVVAIGHDSLPISSESHLIANVTGGTVGLLIGRAFETASTNISAGLGLTSGADNDWQGTSMTVLDNTHPITSHLSLGGHNFGYRYATEVTDAVGTDATVLMNGGDGNPSLVVHDSVRAAIIPYYGHFKDEGLATADALTLTDNAILWAAAIPEPSSALLFGVGAIGFTVFRRKKGRF